MLETVAVSPRMVICGLSSTTSYERVLGERLLQRGWCRGPCAAKRREFELLVASDVLCKDAPDGGFVPRRIRWRRRDRPLSDRLGRPGDGWSRRRRRRRFRRGTRRAVRRWVHWW